MKKLILIIILLAIVVFTVASYFFIAHFSSPESALTPTVTISQTSLCSQKQLSGNISVQAAAGNIYATLTLTNTGGTSCTVVLGNTVTAIFDAKNIVTQYEHTVPTENVMLAPKEEVYSQIHYPNGPQCQSQIIQKSISFFYRTDQTSVAFNPTGEEKLIVQACSSPIEKTIIDIWPLSKTPITP